VILAHHTQPEEAAAVFNRVKPKLAVYCHFVLLGTPTIPPVTEQQVFDTTRKTYAGPLLIGEDLMAFRLDADQVVQLPLRKP
jgi:ribonuclease Z